MKKSFNDRKLIEVFSKKMNGIFTLADLKALLNPSETRSFQNRIKQLENEGVLDRFCRGFYTTPNYSLEILSQKICPSSYISLGNILAQEVMIGTIPRNQIMAVKIGKRRVYHGKQDSIVHLGINKELYFGFKKMNGLLLATPEKAFVDTLYFHQKGQKYFFDIYGDINIGLLSVKIIRSYLKYYKNKKFIAFVESFLK